MTRPPYDFGEYIAALDAEMGNLWRRWYGQIWPEVPEAEPLVPTPDEWVNHVEHVVQTVGAQHVGIGLDLGHGRSTLKDFDASSYRKLVDVFRMSPQDYKRFLAFLYQHDCHIAFHPFREARSGIESRVARLSAG